MRAESARKHEEIMDILKKLAILIGCAKEVEEWEKWRDLNRVQEASEDILSNPNSQIFVTEDCDDESTPEENLVVACSDDESVKHPTQAATIKIRSEDGSNLEEFLDVLTVEEAHITRPIMAVEDEPLMVLESDGMINKKEFADTPVTVTPVEQSSFPLKRKIKQNQAEHRRMFTWQIILKLECEICLGHLWNNLWLKQEPVPAQRRTWDPGITRCDVLKQHLEDKVFLGAGVLIRPQTIILILLL